MQRRVGGLASGALVGESLLDFVRHRKDHRESEI